MPYVIEWMDADQSAKEKKQRLRGIHVDFVAKNAPRIIASGGFFPDDDDFPNGGLIILDVSTRQEAVDYAESDPFFLNGIYTTYKIRRWKKFIFDHKRIPT